MKGLEQKRQENMTNTAQPNKKDILEAAKRVISDTRPEEVELMDDAELEAYNRSKEIIRKYYAKQKGSR